MHAQNIHSMVTIIFFDHLLPFLRQTITFKGAPWRPSWKMEAILKFLRGPLFFSNSDPNRVCAKSFACIVIWTILTVICSARLRATSFIKRRVMFLVVVTDMNKMKIYFISMAVKWNEAVIRVSHKNDKKSMPVITNSEKQLGPNISQVTLWSHFILISASCFSGFARMNGYMFIQYIARNWPWYSLRGLHIRITWFSLYGIRIPFVSLYDIHMSLLPYMVMQPIVLGMALLWAAMDSSLSQGPLLWRQNDMTVIVSWNTRIPAVHPAAADFHRDVCLTASRRNCSQPCGRWLPSGRLPGRIA